MSSMQDRLLDCPEASGWSLIEIGQWARKNVGLDLLNNFYALSKNETFGSAYKDFSKERGGETFCSDPLLLISCCIFLFWLGFIGESGSEKLASARITTPLWRRRGGGGEESWGTGLSLPVCSDWMASVKLHPSPQPITSPILPPAFQNYCTVSCCSLPVWGFLNKFLPP